MTVLFRPLSAASAHLRDVAKRLGRRLLARGKGSANAVQDGFLLRASSDGKTARVIALDPEAVWLLAYWNQYQIGQSWPISSAVRHLSRHDLWPGAPSAPDPLDASLDNALFQALHGAALTGPLSGSQYYFAQSQPDWRGEYAVATAYLTDSATLTLGPSTKTYIQAMASSYRSRFAAFGAAIDLTYRLDGQMRYAFTEDYLRTWLGNSRFRLLPHDPPWSPSASLQVTAPRIVTEGSAAPYEHLTLATTFVLQGPADEGLAGEVEYGWFVGRFRAIRDTFYATRPLAGVWGRFFRASTNPEPALRAAADTLGGWRRHVVGVGIAEDDDAIVAVVCTAREDDPGSGAVIAMGVQVFVFVRATGAYSATTEALVSFDATAMDTTVKPFRGVLNRLVYPVPVGTVLEQREALACVQFSSLDTVQADSIELVLYRTTGAKLVTGLGAAGYAPFWPSLRGSYTPWGNVENLGYQVAPQHSVVQYLGNGLLGVIAAPRAAVAGSGSSIAWELVVLRASDLSFVESRGVIETLPFSTWAVMCFSVVQQETDTALAVLAAWCFSQFPSQNGHRLSRDGGRTWQPLFSGVHGLPIYLGNQLHPVEIGQGL